MLTTGTVFAVVIPESRRINWADNTGVPNGITSRSVICKTLDSTLYGNGQTDASAAINDAIKNCPDNQVIYLPEGRYKLSSSISFLFKSNVTLRGAGPKKTILLAALPKDSKVMTMGGGGYNRFPLNSQIISGNTKGSSTLLLSDASSLKVGYMMVINQENDPDFVFDTASRERMLRQTVMIKAINGNLVQFDPPLVWTFDRNPQILYFKFVCQNSGIEDLKIDLTDGLAGMGIFLDGCYGCWIKNVESYMTENFHFWGYASSRCELRDSFANDSKTTGPNHAGLILSSDNSGWKVENNIFYRMFPGIEVSVSVGNAFAYNYLTDVDSGAGFIGVDMDDNHGPHVMMNLWEGNSGIMFQSDGYFGSGSHGTLFRNHFRGEHRLYELNRKAVSLNRWAYYYNVVGNVLGAPSFPSTGVYDIDVPYNYNTAVIYQLGYPNMGNNGFVGVRPPSTSDQARDLKVAQTVLRHANFDYKNKVVLWNTDNQFGSLDQILPPSLLYKSQPTWWPSQVSWPPIGSDLSPMVNKIPAQLRFEESQLSSNPGVNYYVDQQTGNDINDGASPSSAWKTIQHAASLLTAGQTVFVQPGIYDEKVTVINSGADSKFITYQAVGSVRLKGFILQNKSFIRIKGFELTDRGMTPEKFSTASVYLDSVNNIQVIDNKINETADSCIRMRDILPSLPSNSNLVQGNIISGCGKLNSTGPGIGIIIYGNNNLVEENDISHIGDDFTRLTGGNFNVIRNNQFHDNSNADWPGSVAHIDGVQNYCAAGGIPLHNALIENNTLSNAPDNNSHFVIFQDMGNCGSSDVITRYNTVKTLGSYFLVNDDRVKGVRIYNNTFVDLEVGLNPKDWTAGNFVGNSTGGILMNNVFVNSVRDGGSVYSFDASSLLNSFASNNAVYNTTCGSTCTWGATINNEIGGVKNSDLQLVDLGQYFDFKTSSKLLDAGAALTKVSISDSGNGTSLIVDNAGFFQAGWAGTKADWIAIGTSINVAQIVSVDYANNVIILASPLVRKDGDSVWLFKDSIGRQTLQGSQVDIGAHEKLDNSNIVDTQPPTIPINVQAQAVSSSQINLTWNPSTDNIGVIGYLIYRNGASSPSMIVTGTTYNDTLLNESTSYGYQISAIDQNLNESPKSIVVSATTLVNSGGGPAPKENGGSESSIVTVNNVFSGLQKEIEFHLSLNGSGHVNATLLTSKGEELMTLLDADCEGNSCPPIKWDAHTVNRQRASSGIYLVKIKYQNSVEVKKIVVVK